MSSLFSGRRCASRFSAHAAPALAPIVASCFAFAIIFLSSLAHGAAINYGDFDDIPPGVVVYTDVTESGLDVPPRRFDVPTPHVNSLDFDPINFEARAEGAEVDALDVQLNTTIMTMVPDRGIQSLLFVEGGDFRLLGTGTAATQVSSGLNVRVTVLAVDGVSLAPEDIFTVLGNNQFTADLVNDGPTAAGQWDFGVLLEFPPVLIQHGIEFEFGVTKAEIVLDNTLVAIGEAQSFASIKKKEFRITPGGELDPNEIPEPSTLGLITLVAGFVSMNYGRRRFS